jgi:hypothetical protein
MAELRSHAAFLLHVHLKQGHDLPAKDSCGTSDPYVKFFHRGKLGPTLFFKSTFGHLLQVISYEGAGER